MRGSGGLVLAHGVVMPQDSTLLGPDGWDPGLGVSAAGPDEPLGPSFEPPGGDSGRQVLQIVPYFLPLLYQEGNPSQMEGG